MEEFKELTRDELKKWMDEGKDFVLIDVLGTASYEGRHLPGAVDVGFGGVDFMNRVDDIVDNKDIPVVVYCASFECQSSPAAASKLSDSGYTDVYHFAGGLADWEDGGYEFK